MQVKMGAVEGSGDPLAGARGMLDKGKTRTTGGKALKALGWIATVILVLVLLVAAFLMLAPRFGLQAYAVTSGSMEPALKTGGMIICRDVAVEDIETGDIIVFNNPADVTVTHRVIDISEEEGTRYFQTKGDANEDPDPDRFSISGDHASRVIYHLPYLGFFSSFMRTKPAFLIFLCIPAAVLLLFFARDMWKALREIRLKK